MGLHDAVGQQDGGVEDDAEAQDLHQPGSQNQFLSGVAAQQRHDGLSQCSKAEGTGHGDQGGDPGGGFFRCPDGGVFAQRQGAGDGGDSGDGDGVDEGAGHIENGLGHVVNALHGVCRILNEAGGQQLGHVDLHFQKGDDLQARRADGDGNGDGQQFFGGGAVRGCLPLILLQRLISLTEQEEQVNSGNGTAGGDTENGAAGGHGDLPRHIQQQGSGCKA